MTRKHAEKSQMPLLPGVLYDQRFLEAHAGSQILHDPKTAIVELIANAWDAGATIVKIAWPNWDDDRRFAIEDNGLGMTDAEFNGRWRRLSYNRREEQGSTVAFPSDIGGSQPERVAFGRNGVGRWSAFCFAPVYTVDTKKNGIRNCYRVNKGSGADQPFEIQQFITNEDASGHGTIISCQDCRRVSLSAEEARAEIGMRFLTDPNFQVSVNNVAVSFEHIDDPNITKMQLPLDDGNTVELIIIDTQETDRTTRQHGIAWHVRGRLVGSCSWKGAGADDLIDGRRIAAKRFTFIVRADHLADAEAIKRDWSGFHLDNETFQRAAQAVYAKVREYLLSVSQEDRQETFARAREANQSTLKAMGPLEREKWKEFVNAAQEKCPSIKTTDILKLSEVVANLEHSRSGYALLHKLSQYGPDQLDDLHRLLDDWTVDMAKIALDEIALRLRLIGELAAKVFDTRTQEVQELQPLFKRGLWIFGPEFETIEYTSNESMTRVVQALFKSDVPASLNRPDFVVLPDGTSGLYTYPRYDKDCGEIGAERLVIVELKKPGVKIGEEQKAQCWKYVKELYSKGFLQERVATVRCFVIGSHVDHLESSTRVDLGGAVEIQPMMFDTVLQRAKSRMLKLHDRVRNAPFLESHRQEIEEFLQPVEADEPEQVQVSLFDAFKDGPAVAGSARD